MPFRVAILVLACVAAVMTWRVREERRSVVLVRAGSPVLAGGFARAPSPADAPAATDELAGFLVRATPDDVARGVNALRAGARAGVPTAAPALSPSQEAALATLTLQGRDAHVARDALRAERRAAEAAWLDASASVVAVLPAGAVAAMSRPAGPNLPLRSQPGGPR